jgi:hypothetical protein
MHMRVSGRAIRASGRKRLPVGPAAPVATAVAVLLVLVASSLPTLARSGSRASVLRAGSALSSGASLTSRNGTYKLDMQTDGNLVLYGLYGTGVVVWASNTPRHHGAFAVMKRDGNFVVYDHHRVIWASRSHGRGDAGPTLVVRDNGEVVIYSRAHRAIWQTGTLPPPPRLASFSSPPLPGEGAWYPAGRRVNGQFSVYETLLRPPGSSAEAGLAWMDTNLLRAALYSGSESPGYGPWRLTAPISRPAARTLVAAFNGGFKFPASEGGYYAEGRFAYPLRPGGASLVIYQDGRATVGEWGRDVRMTRGVVAVRQNLTLLVDGGRPVAGLNPYDTGVWGSTLGGIPNVWRSGVGVTARGALVYVTGPSLEITQLAALLVRAGCVRAMTLDMNPDWTVLATYDPPAAAGIASPANGQNLLAGMVQQPSTFFESWWARDFVTVSARWR